MKFKIVSIVMLILVLIVLLWTFSDETKKGRNMTILQKQPVFTLKIEGFGSVYFVIVNGVTVFRQYNPNAQVSTTIPVNHYMRSGSNSIVIATWSGNEAPINPHANIKVDLMVNDFSSPDSMFVVSNIDYKNSAIKGDSPVKTSTPSGAFNSVQGFNIDESGDVIVSNLQEKNNGVVYEFERMVNIPSSLPLWEFFGSENLPDYDSMTDEKYYKEMDTLFPYYLRLQDAIKDNDIDSVMTMFEERNRELDAAFYNPPGTLEVKIRQALNAAATDNSAELVGLELINLNFMKQENNRLVSLSRGPEDPAVGLNYKEHTGSYSFDMIFRKKDGEWILTR